MTSTVTGAVLAFGVSRHAWTPLRAGSATITLTWSGPVDLDLYVGRSSCVSLYPKSACSVLASSVGASGNRESVAMSVQPQDGLAVFVDNLDVARSQEYAISFEVK